MDFTVGEYIDDDIEISPTYAAQVFLKYFSDVIKYTKYPGSLTNFDESLHCFVLQSLSHDENPCWEVGEHNLWKLIAKLRSELIFWQDDEKSKLKCYNYWSNTVNQNRMIREIKKLINKIDSWSEEDIIIVPPPLWKYCRNAPYYSTTEIAARWEPSICK